MLLACYAQLLTCLWCINESITGNIHSKSIIQILRKNFSEYSSTVDRESSFRNIFFFNTIKKQSDS